MSKMCGCGLHFSGLFVFFLFYIYFFKNFSCFNFYDIVKIRLVISAIGNLLSLSIP